MSLTLPAKMQYRKKQELIHAALRDEIMRCDLAPGQRLIIDEIARRFEVSAIPVREALQNLQAEGLVTTVPHVGATVAAISRESIDEVFTVMEGLEIVATRSAAQRLRESDAELLEGIVSEMDSALARERYEDWADLNSRFHLGISKVSDMPMLHEMTERVLARWDRLRRYYFKGVLLHRVEQAQGEHREMLAAMKARDLTALERLVKHHTQSALVAYTEFLRSLDT